MDKPCSMQGDAEGRGEERGVGGGRCTLKREDGDEGGTVGSSDQEIVLAPLSDQTPLARLPWTLTPLT